MRIQNRVLSAVAGFALLAAGCGGRQPGQTHAVKIDIGGIAVYAEDANEVLPGVLVTIADIDGRTWTATTSSAGLWTVENLPPGPYVETFTKDGYEPLERRFTLDAFGENDVANVFVDRGFAPLPETLMRAVVTTPFSIEVENQEHVFDGIGGVSAVYQPSVHGDIVVTVNRVVQQGQVYLYEPAGGDFILATQEDTATGSVFTISEADLDAVNGGAGLLTDSDPYTWHVLTIANLRGYSPIHGIYDLLFARVETNVTP